MATAIEHDVCLAFHAKQAQLGSGSGGRNPSVSVARELSRLLLQSLGRRLLL
jgi:hypothetical protein